MDNHDINRSLGQIEGKVDGINERLDKLNGTVGRHERRIGELEAERAALAATAKANRQWKDDLAPAVKLAIAFFLGLVLSHSQDILRWVVKP